MINELKNFVVMSQRDHLAYLSLDGDNIKMDSNGLGCEFHPSGSGKCPKSSVFKHGDVRWDM